MRLSGSKAAAVHCPFCPTTLDGDKELQEHLLSVHVNLQVQEQLPTSHTVSSVMFIFNKNFALKIKNKNAKMKIKLLVSFGSQKNNEKNNCLAVQSDGVS